MSRHRYRSLITVIFLLPLITLSLPLDSRLEVADSLFESEKYITAESLYNEVLKTAQGIDKGIGLKGLGNIAFSFGKFEQAKEFYNNALKIFKEFKDKRGEAKIYIGLGGLSVYQGLLDDALQYFNRALGMVQKLKDKSTEDIKNEIAIYGNIGQVYQALDKYDKAVEYYKQAIEKAKEIGYKRGEADNLYHLASVFQTKGEVEQAVKNYESAKSIYFESENKKGTADCLREIGNIYRKLSDYTTALEYLHQSLEFLREVKGKEEYILGEAELFNYLGRLYLELGKFKQALSNFSEANKIFKKMVEREGLITTLENIAEVYLNLGNYDTTLYFYNKAKELIKGELAEAHFYNNFGVLYERMKNYTEALKNYRFAQKFFTSLNDSIGIARALCNISNLSVFNKDYRTAIENYKIALSIIKKTKRRDWQASLLANLGFAQHKNGDLDSAINSLTEAINIVEELRGAISSQEFRSTYLEDKIKVYEELVDIYCEKHIAKEAFNFAERAKSRAFLDLLSGVDISKRKNLSPEIKSLIEKEQNLEKKIEYLTGDPSQTEAIIEHNNVLKELQEKFPDYLSLKSTMPIDISRLQVILDAKTAVVEYFIGANSGYVFVVTDKSLSVKKIDKKPEEIYQAVDSLRTFIRRGYYMSWDDFTRWGRWLYINLLAPVISEIKNSERLCIIPHGILHHLPFSALVKSEDPRKLLIEEYDIFYAPSSSVYEIAHKKNKNKKEKSIIFSKSYFYDHPGWDSLPGTKAEKDSIIAAKALPNLKVFSDADSSVFQPSETNVKRYSKDFDIILFATHGQLDSRAPLDSKILLSKDENEDGILKVREIFNIAIDAYLVTLSACETGEVAGFGKKIEHIIGDELTGLSRAFIYAGTPSVVASLWKVHDVSTPLLMVHFYKNLKSADKVKALCDAQRWLMKDEYYNKPFYWAPFVVIGDWR